MNNKAWAISVAAGILLVVGVVATLFGSGYRFFVVQTPSMGTVAPVGTLVAVKAESSYHVGDIVTYERKNRSYTHRIVDITDQGFITKGDINDATDALPVQPGEIVGLVTQRVPYLGFLVRGLPWIIIGCAIVYGITLLPRVRPSWRWQIRFVGWSLVLSAVALWIRPWVNLVMLSYSPEGDGVAMHLVSTGVFPVKVLETVLHSGQDAVVQQNVMDSSGHYTVIPQLALTPGWFLLLLAICLTPMLASLLIRVEDPNVPEVDEAPVSQGPVHTRRRVGLLALIVTASAVLVALVLQWSTQSAFAASLTNSTNKASTRTYFTCKNAVSSLGSNGTYLAWALDTARSTYSSEPDLSGNSRTGRYTTASSVYTSSVGCNRDNPKAGITFNGTSQCLYEYANYDLFNYYPNTFSLEAWFRTGTKSGGVIVGFGDSRTTVSDNHWDRHIYLDKDGRVVFGVYPGAVQIVYTKAGVNYADNHWHHVVATLSSAGQSLYVDGTLAMTDPTITTAEQIHGYWKVGCGNLDNWRNAATDETGSTALDYSGPKYYTGQIQYAAVYTSVLTAAQVKDHYLAGVA